MELQLPGLVAAFWLVVVEYENQWNLLWLSRLGVFRDRDSNRTYLDAFTEPDKKVFYINYTSK